MEFFLVALLLGCDVVFCVVILNQEFYLRLDLDELKRRVGALEE